MIELSIVTVKNPLDALSTLRVKNGAFDLVVTDLYMPGMTGLELQKQVNEEFKIPVIIMSSDDKESVILKSLDSGAAFYMVKPVNPEDLKSVWRYAVASKIGQGVVNDQEIGSAEGETPSNDKLILCGFLNSSSSVNGERGQKMKMGRKRARNKDEAEEDALAPPKKAKVVWTNTLHNRFLQAVSHLGLEKAVPKKILELMNVPGLTRGNVASHLQKYRMFLKKVAEKGTWTSRCLAERTLRSSFAYGYTSMFKNPQQDHSPFLGQQPFMRTSFQPYGDNLCDLSSSSFGLPRFPNQEATNSVPQLRYGQSSLVGNPTSFQQRPLMFANPYPLHQANRSTSNSTGMNLSSNTITTYGVTSGTSPMFIHLQQNQANLQNYATPFKFSLTGIGCPIYSSGTGSMAIINNSYPSLNHNSNYSGIQLTSEAELMGTGKTRFSGNELSSSSNNGGNGLMNWTPDNNMNNAPTRNGTIEAFGVQGAGSSSTGFGSTNQFSPTFTITNQENASGLSPLSPSTSAMPPHSQQASVLPPQSQQHTSTGLGNTGGENDYAFNNLMINASTLGSISDNQQELGERDLGELLYGSTCATPYQEKNVEGLLNVNLPGCPYYVEMSSPAYEFLNTEFSSACSIADKTPWSEESSGQLQGREETMNPKFGGNVNPVDDYYPSFEKPQCNNSEEPADSALNGMNLNEASISGNEDWGEDFLNSLIGNGPY
ncbi:hypothetical protein P3X46_030621 [Hevea brasiliensis]|uniref:Response regulatory domain-containing protein n=1 Tax=Hevea brasiliensis TaxID=3981 RepID=A0ABQ9KHS3_HEVBR|nr:hypothetical protein P3X46_030621 [Hevea brasiliensis]